MSSYAVPVLENPASLPVDEVYLVASGDLRQSANKVCWQAQSEVERKVTDAFAAEGITDSPRASLRPERWARIHLQPAHGHGCLHERRSRRAHHRRGSGLAIQPQRLLRIAEPSRAHSDRGQLVRPVAGAGGHAEPQWLPAQGGSRFSTIWSKDFNDDFFRKGIREWLAEHRITHDQSHVHRL